MQLQEVNVWLQYMCYQQATRMRVLLQVFDIDREQAASCAGILKLKRFPIMMLLL